MPIIGQRHEKGKTVDMFEPVKANLGGKGLVGKRVESAKPKNSNLAGYYIL